jgi:pimeloyl-ACP methyl ester carboxylesterase
MYVIIVHGAGGSAADHVDIQAAAEARGWHAFGLDLLGHGEYRNDAFGDPAGWIQRYVSPEESLWGVSLGAYGALHAAADEPDVNAVIAIAPTTETIIRERMDSWGVQIDPSFRAQVDASDIFEAVNRIACPVLYVHARDDKRVPLAVSERLHALTPQSELVVLKSGGHSGPAHDPAVHELTLDWLASIPAMGV